MKKSDAQSRINQLRKEINHHRYLYHVLDRPEISDAALDSLKDELFKLEEEFPELVTPDSPTQRVGGEVKAGFTKVVHSSRMLSLNDAFSVDDLEAWMKRLERFDAEAAKKIDFFIEPKVDGLAMSLIYENGSLVVAATRGNGLEGEDVTHAIKTIESIPLVLHETSKISKAAWNGKIEVRGEVYMTTKDFQAINKEREKNGEPLYMNPRNTAAGSVRQLDPKMTATRNLKFMAYALPVDVGQKTHEQEHELLEELGFATDKHCIVGHSLADVMKVYDKLHKQREKIPYQIDGMVVIVNSNALFKTFGIVGKAPRGALALKFPAEQVTTVVEDIQVQVGRTGALTPVAHLRPVLVAGSMVKRATLHNLDEVRRLDVRVGDTVIIEKAGDIIPDVVQVLTNMRPAASKKWNMPKKCPVCGTVAIQRGGEVAYVCPNDECLAQHREQMYYFAGKQAFDFDGLGPSIIDAVIDADLVQTPADFYTLKVEDLLPLERFAEKSAENVIAAIADRTHISLERFIISLGIRHVGLQTARVLAQHYKKIDAVMHATQEELEALPDIGPIVAESIATYMSKPKHRELITDLLKHVKIDAMAAEKENNGPLKGKTILFTGTLESMTRTEAEEISRNELGAETANSVTKNLSILVVGENAGSKLAKAQKQGVHIMTEKEFIALFEKNRKSQ